MQRNIVIARGRGEATAKRAGERGRWTGHTRPPGRCLLYVIVEFYLFRDGRFGDFIGSLRRLPRLPRGVVVRSVFRSGGAGAAPLPVDNSASLTQPISEHWSTAMRTAVFGVTAS